jgi:hypothetical protein
VRLGQDRLSGVRESQRVRVSERHPIPQRSAYQAKTCHFHKRFKPIQCTVSNGMNNFLGQEKVTIHPQASMRAKGWRGEKTNRMWVVEKPAGEEPSGQRFLTWVVRHLSWRCSRGRHPVEETGGYCWSFYFHVTPLLSLCRIFSTSGPAITAFARHYRRHFEDDQQYPGVFGGCRISRNLIAEAHPISEGGVPTA